MYRGNAIVPTGPVLGGFDAGTFTESVVSLLPGDVLALFTDGMTEIGPNRKDLLELEGVSQILQQYVAGNLRFDKQRDPQAILDYLVSGVDAFGQGGVRDDIALLVGVVS
jgi:serine phosphatase RsbU (regulator of sigma subunit)